MDKRLLVIGFWEDVVAQDGKILRLDELWGKELTRVAVNLKEENSKAMKNGAVSELAKRLLYVLDSYDSFLKSSPSSRPISDKYTDFKEVLKYLADAKCNGCREDHCMSSDCIVPECTKSQGIHFCYECGHFPCNKTGFADDLKEKWIRKNNKIKAIGIERYFEEEKALPHYAS